MFRHAAGVSTRGAAGETPVGSWLEARRPPPLGAAPSPAENRARRHRTARDPRCDAAEPPSSACPRGRLRQRRARSPVLPSSASIATRPSPRKRS